MGRDQGHGEDRPPVPGLLEGEISPWNLWESTTVNFELELTGSFVIIQIKEWQQEHRATFHGFGDGEPVGKCLDSDPWQCLYE